MSGRATNCAKRTGVVRASTLGSTSPNSSSRNVTTTVLNRKSSRTNVKRASTIPAVRIVMQIFTKLLATSMVASSMSTSPSRRSTAAAEADVRSRSRCTSLCESEKNDVSAPDTNAEMHSRPEVTAQSAIMRGEKPLKRIQCVASKPDGC